MVEKRRLNPSLHFTGSSMLRLTSQRLQPWAMRKLITKLFRRLCRKNLTKAPPQLHKEKFLDSTTLTSVVKDFTEMLKSLSSTTSTLPIVVRTSFLLTTLQEIFGKLLHLCKRLANCPSASEEAEAGI